MVARRKHAGDEFIRCRAHRRDHRFVTGFRRIIAVGEVFAMMPVIRPWSRKISSLIG
jgi:hypothetical protein